MGNTKETERQIDKSVDQALTRFFYNKILEAMLEAEIELVQDEEYMAAAKVRNKIEELENEFSVKLNR